MRFSSRLLLGLCVVMWSSLVCVRGCFSTHVSVVGEMTVMRVLLSVFHVCILRECEGDGNAGVGGQGEVW